MSEPQRPSRGRKPATPVVSVIVPVKNGMPFLSEQLSALADQDFDRPWELIVVDNGSTDGTRAEVARFETVMKVTVIDASEAVGVAAVRNIGAWAASGRAVVFCDADDIAEPGWLAAMAASLETADAVGGALELELLNTSEARGARWTFGGGLDRPGGYLPVAIGCNIGIVMAAYRAIGGFDETFRGVAEDTDICWRLQRAGYRLVFAPDAVMHYRLRGGLGQIMRQSRAYGKGAAQLAAVYSQEFEPDTTMDVVRTAYWAATRSVSVVLGARRRLAYLSRLAHLRGQIAGCREFGFAYRTLRPLRMRAEHANAAAVVAAAAAAAEAAQVGRPG